MIETVLTVGAAISKAVLRIWLKDDISVATGDSLIDIIKGRVNGTLEQQEIERQFSAIGDRVAKSLEPLFEDSSLREYDRDSIARAIVDTFASASIDAKLLARCNLEPTTLAKFIKKSRPDSTRDFSAHATELYNRIIEESSEYIVSVAVKLPRFTEHILGTILQREHDLVSLMMSILEEVRQLRSERYIDDG